MKYTASTKIGIGTIEAQDDKFYTVYWADEDKTTKVLISLAKVYDSEEEAEVSLDEKILEKENDRAEMLDVKFDAKHQNAMEEMKERARFNQRSSSMR